MTIPEVLRVITLSRREPEWLFHDDREVDSNLKNPPTTTYLAPNYVKKILKCSAQRNVLAWRRFQDEPWTDEARISLRSLLNLVLQMLKGKMNSENGKNK